MYMYIYGSVLRTCMHARSASCMQYSGGHCKACMSVMMTSSYMKYIIIDRAEHAWDGCMHACTDRCIVLCKAS